MSYEITEIDLFKNLTEDIKESISNTSEKKQLHKGDIVFDPYTNYGLIYILSGKVKLYTKSDKGNEELYRIAEEKETIGEQILFLDRKPLLYAEAISNCEILELGKAELCQILMENPEAAICMLGEYNKLLAKSQCQKIWSSDEEVIDRIKSYLTEISEGEGTKTFMLPLTMKELADYLSTTPETISRRFKKLEESGYLKRRGRKVTLL